MNRLPHTVSGISSGGFMAVQHHVVWSADVDGVTRGSWQSRGGRALTSMLPMMHAVCLFWEEAPVGGMETYDIGRDEQHLCRTSVTIIVQLRLGAPLKRSTVTTLSSRPLPDTPIGTDGHRPSARARSPAVARLSSLLPWRAALRWPPTARSTSCTCCGTARSSLPLRPASRRSFSTRGPHTLLYLRAHSCRLPLRCSWSYGATF